MNKGKVFNYSLDHCIKVNITWLSKLIEALPKATDPEVKVVMRFNRNAMQMQLIEFVEQAREEDKPYPASHYHAIMSRSYKSEQLETEEAIKGNEILQKGNGKSYTKDELEESLDNIRELIQHHAQCLVNISHPNCDGPHDVIIGDHYISLD